MVIFRDIQDVEEWLGPLGYVAFWEAVAPYRLALQDRDACDDQIARGIIDQGLVLSVLKRMAVPELSAKLGLKDRVIEPLAAETLTSVH